MKKLDSRRMTRNFLSTLNEISLVNYDIINTKPENDYKSDAVSVSSHHDIDPDNDGIISQEDLFNHFDLDNNGTVTTDEYLDHIQYHSDNPETLDHYREDVPCNNSYNSCYNHHDSDNEILMNCISQTGATCIQSGIQALIDVLTSMKQKGII